MEEIKDVNVDPSSTEPVKEVEAGTQPVAEAPPQEGQPDLVPAYKVDEWKRKHNELLDRMPEMAREAAREVTQSFTQSNNQQDRNKRITDLRRFATENPEYASQAQIEISQLEREENKTMISQVVKEQLGSFQDKTQGDQKKQQAYQYVSQTYPEIFTKDNNGRMTGWDANHPVTRIIGQLMQDKRFADDPEGLSAAADIAYGRHMRSQSPQAQVQTAKLKSEVSALKQKTLVEGGGAHAEPSPTEYQAAIDKAKQTGRMRDAQEAMKQILKSKGTLVD